MQASCQKHVLRFKVPAQTSRGAYSDKEVWLLSVNNKGRVFEAEASPLQGLSIDPIPEMGSKLQGVCDLLNRNIAYEDIVDQLQLHLFPSIAFAVECVFESLKHPKDQILFPSAFTDKLTGIPVNGLVWMNDIESMWRQAEEKITSGFSCIKLKIGALDFDAECRLLERLRKKYTPFKVTLRVDANGAFETTDAREKLRDLARFDLHSIEQPIRPKQPEAMQELCATSPVPIALDEELIGVSVEKEGDKIIKHIRPQFLILKPTLVGGFRNCNHWIKLASRYEAGWWITSALESNIGLGAIAQYCGSLKVTIPQGLGTGMLYMNNFPSVTEIKEGTLYYTGSETTKTTVG